MPSLVQLFCISLETSHGSTTERPSFHDLITQIFLRSLRIVVMGAIDAFVYGHNHHRRNMDNLVNFGDCMKGSIRLMTEKNSSIYSRIPINLLGRTFLLFSIQNFVCRMPKPDTSIFPSLVPQHTKEAMTFRVGPSTLTEVLALLVKP